MMDNLGRVCVFVGQRHTVVYMLVRDTLLCVGQRRCLFVGQRDTHCCFFGVFVCVC